MDNEEFKMRDFTDEEEKIHQEIVYKDAKPLRQRIPREEAIRISHEIMEKAEKARDEAVAKELSYFWEEDGFFGYLPAEAVKQANEAFDKRCINTGLNIINDPTELIRVREENKNLKEKLEELIEEIKKLKAKEIVLPCVEKFVEKKYLNTKYFCPTCGVEIDCGPRCGQCGQKVSYSFDDVFEKPKDDDYYGREG